MYSYVFILITLIAFDSAYSSEIPTNEPVKRITLNDCFDKHLSKLAPIIKNYGLDPMTFPDISKEIYGVTLNLTDGVISGASNLLALGECSITFYPKYWRFHVKIHPGKLEYKSNYSSEKYILGFHPEKKGSLVASIENNTVSISFDLEILTFTFQNPQIHIDDFGILSVDMGQGKIASEFQKLLISFLQKQLKSSAESTALDAANDGFSIQNENVNATITSVFRHVAPILGKLYLNDIGNRLDVHCLLARYTNKNTSDSNFSIAHYTKLANKLLTTAFWKQLKSDIQENGEACVKTIKGEFEKRNLKL